jgi:hypothetical protein
MNGTISRWAPIALFVYKRPEHAVRTIESLRACPGYDQSTIYVFADGPRTEADIPAVKATRAAVRELVGPRAVIAEQDSNRGLANSIIAGTTEICQRHGRVVVVEDDLVVAPSFLQFLNEGLERFEGEPRVMQVSGHMFDVPELADSREALFLPMTTSWGWATWKRAWDHFDPHASGWRERLVGPEAMRFDLGGRYDYCGMLKRQQDGRVDSWAIRWYYSVFANGGLVLYPPRSLVINAGFDGTGTHGRLSSPSRQTQVGDGGVFGFPAQAVESPDSERVFEASGKLRVSGWRRPIAIAKLATRRFRSMRAAAPRSDNQG